IPPKRTSTSVAPAITQDAIWQLVANSVTGSLEAQAATMASTDNLNRNTGPRETPVAKRGNYKEFISCQPFYFNGMEGAVGLICWFERNESVFTRSNCAEENKVTFATGPCTFKCNTCNKVGHLTRNCRNKGPATGSNQQPVLVIFHACGKKGHYANQCPKINNNARGRTYLLRDKNTHRDPNVVTGMFLLNQHLAKVLFDSGADKRFISISLASMLNIPPITLDTTYDIKMANGNLVGNHQLRVRDEDIPKNAFRARPMTFLFDFSRLTISPNVEVFKLFSTVEDFSKFARSLTELTKKNKKYIQGEDQESAFQLLKQKLCEAPILALPEGNDDFIVYSDASHQADALIQKERIKPLRVTSLVMTIHPKFSSQILEAQTEEMKEENIKAENLRGMDKTFEIRPDRTRCIKNRS
nr:reverse transcriptase domain-containing protein [Tanacetum cinerariifolium]